MKMNKCGYLIREGFRSIKTHRFMSFASVTIILACLLIMGSFSLVAVNINSFIKDLGSRHVLYIDFKPADGVHAHYLLLNLRKVGLAIFTRRCDGRKSRICFLGQRM